MFRRSAQSALRYPISMSRLRTISRVLLLFLSLGWVGCASPPPVRAPLMLGEGGVVDQCLSVERSTGPRKSIALDTVDGIAVTREAHLYTIRAETEAILKRAMYNLGEIAEDGRYGASVRWRFSWTYDHDWTEEGCRPDAIEVALRIEFAFPRWADKTEADPDLQVNWENFLDALDDHERGHECSSLRAAAEIKAELDKMGPRDNCEQLQLDAEALSSRIAEKWHAVDVEFDRVTNHGAREGAFFP